MIRMSSALVSAPGASSMQHPKSQFEECTGGIHRKYNIKYLSFSVRVRH